MKWSLAGKWLAYKLTGFLATYDFIHKPNKRQNELHNYVIVTESVNKLHTVASSSPQLCAQPVMLVNRKSMNGHKWHVQTHTHTHYKQHYQHLFPMLSNHSSQMKEMMKHVFSNDNRINQHILTCIYANSPPTTITTIPHTLEGSRSSRVNPEHKLLSQTYPVHMPHLHFISMFAYYFHQARQQVRHRVSW